MNKYLGITIGPILGTLDQARKTREAWLGSFFFSYIMKVILKYLKEKEYGDFFAVDTSLLDSEDTFYGAGIFNDRCYLKLHNDFTKTDYHALLDYVYSELCALNLEDKQRDGSEKKKYYELLRQYTQIYCTVKTIDKKENILEVLNQSLDVMELQTKYYPGNIYALASGYIERRETFIGKQSVLPTSIEELTKWYELAFAKEKSENGKTKFNEDELIYYENIKGGIYSFSSILEISTTGLKKKNKDNYSSIHNLFEKSLSQEMDNNKEEILEDEKIDEYKILHRIKKIYGDDFRTAHKYMAVVKADGDGIGKLITQVSKNSPGELNEFSANLTKFAREAAGLIHDYGGKPVYIGGDDLFFFAPVVSYQDGKNTNIFELIPELDRVFNSKWNTFTDKYGIKPTLSYGLTITYYKYPMNESIGLANSLLFDTAKELPGKNCIAIQLMTHSGGLDKAVFSKNEGESFNKLLGLVDQFGKEDRNTVVGSVLQRLRGDQALLLAIAEDRGTFDAYFTNEYDLRNLKGSKKEEYIKYSIALFNEIFPKHEKKKEALDELCTMYRLLNFLIHREP